MPIQEPTGIRTDSPGWERKVEKILRKRIGEVAAGVHRGEARRIMFGDLKSDYLLALELSGSKSLRRGAGGKPYLEAVERLSPFFDGAKADEIGPTAVRDFQRQELAKGLSNGSINRSISCLRRMFTLALQEERISSIPHFPMLRESKPRQGTLSAEKYTELLTIVPDYVRPIVTIAFRTGMRAGEVLNLRWQDVDWLNRTLRITDSKNGDVRTVPFVEGGDLEQVLRERFAQRQSECDRVCYRLTRLGHAVPVGNFRKVWRRACCKIGLGKFVPVTRDGEPVFETPRHRRSKPKQAIRYVGLILHDLRRSFITDAEHAGAPRHEVMKMSGHRTESVYKRYAIENPERRREALAQIDEYRSRSQKVRGQNGDILGSEEHGKSVSH